MELTWEATETARDLILSAPDGRSWFASRASSGALPSGSSLLLAAEDEGEAAVADGGAASSFSCWLSMDCGLSAWKGLG